MSYFLQSTLQERGQSTENPYSSLKDNNTENILARKWLWILLRASFYWGTGIGGYWVIAQKLLWSFCEHYCQSKAPQSCKVLTTCNLVFWQQERRRSQIWNNPWSHSLCLTLEQWGAKWQPHSLQKAKASPVLEEQTVLMFWKWHQLSQTAFGMII